MTCRARSPEGRIVCKSIQNTSLTSPDTNYYQIDQVRTHLVTFGPVSDPVSGLNTFDSCVFSIQNVSKNRPDERTDGRTDARTHTHGFVYGPHTISPSGNNDLEGSNSIPVPTEKSSKDNGSQKELLIGRGDLRGYSFALKPRKL